jgi:hypothetical protein
MMFTTQKDMIYIKVSNITVVCEGKKEIKYFIFLINLLNSFEQLALMTLVLHGVKITLNLRYIVLF